MTTHVRRRARRPIALAVSLMLALFSLGGLAQAANGPTAKPTLVSPKNHKSLALNSRPVFKVRDHGAGAGIHVFIAINKHKKVTKSGELRAPSGAKGGTFAQANRHKHDLFTYKPPSYSFMGWFMATPGKYYWQAQHADCFRQGCHALSGIRSFRVR